MIKKKSSNEMRIKRHNRLRKNISGTPERPRLCVYRSNAHVSVQVIDDVNRVTIVSASSMDKDLKLTNGGNVEAAKAVGELAAKKALAKGVKAVVFDRGGYIYHGRIKALADAARAAGLEF